MQKILKQLRISALNAGTTTGLKWLQGKGEKLASYSPVDGKLIGTVYSTTKNDYEKVLATAQQAFTEWRLIPAPKRGEEIGRAHV